MKLTNRERKAKTSEIHLKDIAELIKTANIRGFYDGAVFGSNMEIKNLTEMAENNFKRTYGKIMYLLANGEMEKSQKQEIESK